MDSFSNQNPDTTISKNFGLNTKTMKDESAWAWARKAADNSWMDAAGTGGSNFGGKPLNWRPVRLTGRLKLRHRSGGGVSMSDLFPEDDPGGEGGDRPTCRKQFHEYCDFTTMHGIRYIAEKDRTVGEKIFWSIWCFAMFCTAIYMMSKIYTRWESSPVITSVSNTNYPVTNINFPAVTVCTVNKAVNEKMIIQGCRYNLTLTQIRSIIGTLVDPEARNNDNLQVPNVVVNPKMAIKYLRLVAPKCDDYLLTCRWNSASIKCTNLFKLTLTDSGYCCSFNSIPQKYRKSDPRNDGEVLKQEAEFDFLQKAVWDYTDRFREKNGPPTENEDVENGVNQTSTDSFTCARIYDDDLFPGICKYIQKCRDNPRKCRLSQPLPTTAPLGLNLMDEFPLKAVGAGRSRGLTLMLDTLRCDTVPTDSFKGLRVLVHDPDEFPAVSERGFIVGPGMENQIAITGTDIYSEEVLRNFAAYRRGCYFSDEFPLKYYTDYSRSSCVVECETEFIFRQCQCTPYYSPGNYSICSVDKINGCVRKAIDVIQKKTKPANLKWDKIKFNFKNPQDQLQDKSCTEFCLPACNETSYGTVVTSADFPNQVEPNKTKMLREAISDGRLQLNDINYVSASISVLRIFFRQSSVVQFRRDEMFAWEDFVSNLGGVMGLCLGFSILSIVEVIYFFTIRLLIDTRRYRKSHPTMITMDDNGPTFSFKY